MPNEAPKAPRRKYTQISLPDFLVKELEEIKQKHDDKHPHTPITLTRVASELMWQQIDLRKASIVNKGK